ncbi:copper chaperone PCu(A)C [Streptomyces sp. SID11385]|uniref:copper chaperone PCu(A)C n=1 Tax=Streptomyces sp. SID11385 TaxID=2706031 RepID=UPI0013C5C777|nr:copper chaperone PCu(A)C [Streptomyces sp. SID11385]NEA38758.1 copper chaperone PCu(A)C [Streptomyces sp. SID11385]
MPGTFARFRAPLAAVGVPVLASGLALAGLGAWTASGRAGSPARVTVTKAYVYQPLGTTPETAAFFTLGNDGGSADLLTGLTSPDTTTSPLLSRHRMTTSGAAYRQPVDSVRVPAGDGLTMAPHGIDVTVRPKSAWRPGDEVSFTLRFAHGAPRTVHAVVVRPGADTDGLPRP